ncbi:MAG: hypothetical protein NTZ34_08625 [Chloroflexi bacterium]|nr:hypothetical protein [Chloroflexota bacterium]
MAMCASQWRIIEADAPEGTLELDSTDGSSDPSGDNSYFFPCR